ncbi:assimilatory sulfite reductase (NADPH) flavoprotein subunit [Labilibacter marinus]|uniref:assimilatory sulfite reductase (NADPH) flavoprotein subunit n=1 Tax=Labilibacter marinus TaxID=1477105 RepID=UPI0009F89019|nr:assimilatory sulfite reductase (NADPH) flavoprotein subunit [Labilibacter marinus]
MIKGINNIFTKEQVEQAQQLFTSLSTEQKYWLSGYLSGLNNSGNLLEGIGSGNATVAQGAVPQETVKLTILYGTHTGNSKILAEQALQLASQAGVEAVTQSLGDYKVRKLKEEQNLLVIVSTHGEGDPPASAEDFYAYIFGKKAPKSDNLNFAVIGLGDSSYAKFCQTGKDIYDQLSSLGAKAVHDFIELDVDYKDTIADILPAVVSKFSAVNGVVASSQQAGNGIALASDAWVEAEVLEKVLLNGKGSAKETYHIEFDIEDSGLVYQPGDALEVVAQNGKALVKDILAQLNISEDEYVSVGNESLSIYDALVNKFEITVVTNPVIKKYAEIAQSEALNALISDDEKLQEYLYGADFLDLISSYPAKLDANTLATLLRKLPPRLYSISSSYEYSPEEVHITVGAVRYDLNEREHHGVCSGFLADQIQEGATVKIRVKPNLGFKLPEDDNTAVIMVGPGTGIAPFRSFLQEREAKESEGKNWLFFGDQHFETDFLYQTELLKYRKEGVVSKLDVAFSRDQEEKIYVQDRLNENGEELFKWLNEGAYFYLCGDMKRMAKDVKDALLQIIQKYGNLSDVEAQEYFRNLKSAGRFQEDVY